VVVEMAEGRPLDLPFRAEYAKSGKFRFQKYCNNNMCCVVQSLDTL